MPNPGPHFDPAKPGQQQISPKQYNDALEIVEKSQRTTGGVGTVVSNNPLGSAIHSTQPPSFWAQITGPAPTMLPARYSCTGVFFDENAGNIAVYADPPSTTVIEINGTLTVPVDGSVVVRATLSETTGAYLFSFAGSGGGGGIVIGSAIFWARINGPPNSGINSGYPTWIELTTHPSILGGFVDKPGGRTGANTGLSAFPALSNGPSSSAGVDSQLQNTGVGAANLVVLMWLQPDASCYQFIVPYPGHSLFGTESSDAFTNPIVTNIDNVNMTDFWSCSISTDQAGHAKVRIGTVLHCSGTVADSDGTYPALISIPNLASSPISWTDGNHTVRMWPLNPGTFNPVSGTRYMGLRIGVNNGGVPVYVLTTLIPQCVSNNLVVR